MGLEKGYNQQQLKGPDTSAYQHQQPQINDNYQQQKGSSKPPPSHQEVRFHRPVDYHQQNNHVFQQQRPLGPNNAVLQQQRPLGPNNTVFQQQRTYQQMGQPNHFVERNRPLNDQRLIGANAPVSPHVGPNVHYIGQTRVFGRQNNVSSPVRGEFFAMKTVTFK